MKTIRLIPRLDIKGPNLIKGVHLEGFRVLGAPEQFALFYCEQGADELIYMDVVASLYGRNSLHDFISRVARRIHIPMTVGGGIRTLDDIKVVLRAGADKVAINTAAVKDPSFIQKAARKYGSSTVVVSIEAQRRPGGGYQAYMNNGREQTGLEVVECAKQAEALGAGEILITSVDREGTGLGYETELIAQVADAVSIPLIACGGCGLLEHPPAAVEAGADAVAMASALHYHFVRQLDKVTSFSEGNTDFLQGDRCHSRIAGTTIAAMKERMKAAGIICRPVA